MTAPTVRRLAVVPSPSGSPATDRSPLPGVSWPVLDPAALHGLAGKVVRTLGPETEADPAALLVSLLVAFGCCVGDGPHAEADGAEHPARLFAVIVGKTAKARKGTSWSRTRQVMYHADEKWISERIVGGLSSGEGLIQAVAGGDDRGLLVYEPEFAQVLTVARREGNILSAVIRQAWDSGDLHVMTKTPLRATGAHVSVLAHITEEELQATLTSIQAANGFANRFLFVCAERRRLLPSGGRLDDATVASLGKDVAEALDRVRNRGTLSRSTAAEERWRELYAELASDDPGGLLGGIVTRADAQLLRLSVVYALLDGAHRIELVHLEAAWALWSYCRQSAAYLFGGRSGDPEADRIVAVLTAMPNRSATRRELQEALGKRPYGTPLDQALSRLDERGRIVVVSEPTRGRPAQRIVLVEPERS